MPSQWQFSQWVGKGRTVRSRLFGLHSLANPIDYIVMPRFLQVRHTLESINCIADLVRLHPGHICIVKLYIVFSLEPDV